MSIFKKWDLWYLIITALVIIINTLFFEYRQQTELNGLGNVAIIVVAVGFYLILKFAQFVGRLFK